MTADPDAVGQSTTETAGATLPCAARSRARVAAGRRCCRRRIRSTLAAKLEARLLDGTGAGRRRRRWRSFGRRCRARRAARLTAGTLDPDRHRRAASGSPPRCASACPRRRRHRGCGRSSIEATDAAIVARPAAAARRRRSRPRSTTTCARPRRPPRPCRGVGSPLRRGLVRLAPAGCTSRHVPVEVRSRSSDSGAGRARLGGTAPPSRPTEIHGRTRCSATTASRRPHDVAATRIHLATGGWPAAVRLALEAYRNAPGGDREAVLDRLQRPEGPIFAYLAEEVVANATDDTRALVRSAVHFDRFSAPLLAAIGVPNPAQTLEELAKRALFLQPLPGEAGWFSLHGLIGDTFAGCRCRRRTSRFHAGRLVRGRGPARGALALFVRLTDTAGPGSSAAWGRAVRRRHAPAVEATALVPMAPRAAIERGARRGASPAGMAQALAAFGRAVGPDGRSRRDRVADGRGHGVGAPTARPCDLRPGRGRRQPAGRRGAQAWIAGHAYRGDAEAAVAAEKARAGVPDDSRAMAAALPRWASPRLANDPSRVVDYAAALVAADRAGDALQVARSAARRARGRQPS